MIPSERIYYGVCDCYIWPLVRYAPVGRCDRCRTRPEGEFTDKQDAFNWYYAIHSSVPKKMAS